MRRAIKNDSIQMKSTPLGVDDFFVVVCKGKGGGDSKQEGIMEVSSIGVALKLVIKHRLPSKLVGVYYSCHDEFLRLRVLYLVTSVYVDFFERCTIEVENYSGGRLLFDVGQWGGQLSIGPSSPGRELFRADSELIDLWRLAHLG